MDKLIIAKNINLILNLRLWLQEGLFCLLESEVLLILSLSSYLQIAIQSPSPNS